MTIAPFVTTRDETRRSRDEYRPARDGFAARRTAAVLAGLEADDEIFVITWLAPAGATPPRSIHADE